MKRFVTFFTKKGEVDLINVTKISKIILGKENMKVYLSSKLVPTSYPIRNNHKSLERLGIESNERKEFPEKSYASPWSDK